MNIICTYPDCGAIIENPTPHGKYCKYHSVEVRKAQHRKAVSKYQQALHKCKTCETMITGRKEYCEQCNTERKQKARKKYIEQRFNPPMPAQTSTSLAWLDKFKGWEGSGMSYAEYQRTHP